MNFKEIKPHRVILGILKINLIFMIIPLIMFIGLKPPITTMVQMILYYFLEFLPVSLIIYAVYFFVTHQKKSQNTDFKPQKIINNKTYIMYSLIIPIIYALMLYLNLHFGSTQGETEMRPYGIISDCISFMIFVLYTFLGIKHFTLFSQNNSNKNLLNKLMLIFNSIYLLLCYIFMGSALAGGVIIVLIALSGLAIPYLIIYCLQIIELIKFIKER